MEMLHNSVVVDARLFPKVDKVTILECGQFMDAKIRSSYVEGRTLRLDTAFVAWDGDAIMGKLPQLMMALVIPHRPGLTLLRQHLGSEIGNFTHVILDPAQPGVVTLVGPRRVPSLMPNGMELIQLEEAAETSAVNAGKVRELDALIAARESEELAKIPLDDLKAQRAALLSGQ